jgi:hypothetical protein
MLRADEINKQQTEINHMWVAARPIKGGFFRRLRDAWQVLKGKAEAVKFYRQ